MAGQQQTAVAVGAHLVGGLKAPDAETAMRTAGGILGRHLHSLTDGETGARNQWIFWQLDQLAAVEGIETAGMKSMPAADNPDYSQFPQLSVDTSVTELPARALGYADAAEASYATFRRLRDEGAIPAALKFQVSLPTAYATVAAWVRQEDQERFFPIYEEALADEVTEIAAAVPAEDLVIQFDVAVEFGVLTGMMNAAGELGSKEFVVEHLGRLLAIPPAGVERGLHLCYGDYKHRHFTVPQDLSLCVEIASAAGDAADFVHMPVDREAGRDPSYHEPLRGLDYEGRLALGVIDYEGDEQRTRELIDAATTGGGGREFAVATECGMARIDERGPGGPSLERLLELHAACAAPLR
jgi:hypothetical protein